MNSMSLEEARKILGDEESAKVSDEQLEKLIWDLEVIARMTLKSIANGEIKMPDNREEKE